MGFIHQDVRDYHLNTFPNEELFLRRFLDGFEVTWGRRRTARNTTLSVYFLKPESFIEETFGFSQEVLLIYSSFLSMEPRAIQAAEQFITDDPGKGRVEKLAFFVVSEMPGVEEWVRSYMASNHESRVMVAFSAESLREAGGDAWYVRNRLAEQLFSRDLFDIRLPLEKDTYFFGREDLVMDYRDAARRGENRGVFGLRKTGKTSFLFKLERILKDEGSLVFYYDCKSPSIRQLRWHELLRGIANDIAKGINTRFKVPADIRRFADKFTELLGRIPSDRRVSIIFDEIEYISPFAIDDKHWEREYVPFWQTIWSAQSRQRHLSVIIAGVNPSVVEIDKIGGIQNPLFGIVSYKYLRGLGIDETRRMLKVLGRRMGLRFSEDAIHYVYSRYGGHPLLTRLACSLFHQRLVAERQDRPVDVEPATLKCDETARDAELTFYCRHVVSEFRDFYPDEYEMFELLATGRVHDFVELSAHPEYVRHLQEYGLLGVEVNGLPKVSIPVVGRYVALEEARRMGRQSLIYIVPPQNRTVWLKRRTIAIIMDMGEIQRLATLNSRPSLFGPNSFPESHRFAQVSVASDENGFESFINCCNRCFVESIESFGAHINKPKYFWKEVASAFPALFDALHRIKVYRHNRMHIRLKPDVEQVLRDYLQRDLEGRDPRHVDDLWFVLQQAVLDALLAGLQVEISKLGR